MDSLVRFRIYCIINSFSLSCKNKKNSHPDKCYALRHVMVLGFPFISSSDRPIDRFSFNKGINNIGNKNITI